MLEELSVQVKKTFSSKKPALSDSDLYVLEKKLLDCSKDIAGAISGMIRVDASVSSCSLNVVGFRAIPRELNIYDDSVFMLYNTIIGTDGGTIIVYSSGEEMARITEMFLHKERGYFNDITDENLSVIREFSTIIAGYYVTALDRLSGKKYELSNPMLSAGLYKIKDKLKEHINTGAMDMESAKFLAFRTDFLIDRSTLNLKTLLLLRAK